MHGRVELLAAVASATAEHVAGEAFGVHAHEYRRLAGRNLTSCQRKVLHFRVGKNMHLVMTDERLYRDNHIVDEAAIAQAQGHDPINGSDSVGARYFVTQPVLSLFEQQKTDLHFYMHSGKWQQILTEKKEL